jgi:Fe-S cluster assembly iron-binding protein IscA
MLKLTPTAATALATARAASGAPDTYGIRFFVTSSPQSEKARLTLDFVESPGPSDAVTEEGGLKAYVAPEVDQLFGDAVVDIETEGSESSLVLRRQRAGDEGERPPPA